MMGTVSGHRRKGAMTQILSLGGGQRPVVLTVGVAHPAGFCFWYFGIIDSVCNLGKSIS